MRYQTYRERRDPVKMRITTALVLMEVWENRLATAPTIVLFWSDGRAEIVPRLEDFSGMDMHASVSAFNTFL